MKNKERNAEIIRLYLAHNQRTAADIMGLPTSVAGVVNRAGVAKNPTGPRNANNDNSALTSANSVTLHGGYYCLASRRYVSRTWDNER